MTSGARRSSSAPPPMVNGGKQAPSADSEQILGLRSIQNTDEISASEPSDGEIEAENVVTLFRHKSHSRNRLHIPNMLKPSVTACSKSNKAVLIADLVPHSLNEEQLSAITSHDPAKGPRLCAACVTARPDRFPEPVVRALVRDPSS